MSVMHLLFVSYCSGFVLRLISACSWLVIGLFFGLLLFWSWVIIGSCCGLTSPVCKIFIYVTRCLRIPMNFLYRIGGDRVHACRVASLSRHGCAHSEKEKRGLPDGTAPSAYRTMVRHGRDWLGLVGSGRVGCGLLGSGRVGKGLVPTSRVYQEIREKGGDDCGDGAWVLFLCFWRRGIGLCDGSGSPAPLPSHLPPRSLRQSLRLPPHTPSPPAPPPPTLIASSCVC